MNFAGDGLQLPVIRSAVPEPDNDFILVIMAGVLVIVPGLDGYVPQRIGMNGLHPETPFLRIRNKPEILLLMARDLLKNRPVNQSDNAVPAVRAALAHQKVAFVPDSECRRFVSSLPLNRHLGRTEVLLHHPLLLRRTLGMHRFEGTGLPSGEVDPHQHGDMPVAALQLPGIGSDLIGGLSCSSREHGFQIAARIGMG
ncbi:hypothetical protein D3C81_273960 [compost metagenome]